MHTAGIEAPAGWAAAIDTIASRQRRRVVVIGPADSGKSSFISAAMATAAEAGAPVKLIDLDPGQKMIGPPGTAGLANTFGLERFIFLGSTSASETSKIVNAAEALADNAPAGFIANTSGFIRGLGARLQSYTLSMLRPDLVVALGDDPSLVPILAAQSNVQVVRLAPSPLARRKSPSQRAAIRQTALSQALERAERLRLNRGDVAFVPGPPATFKGRARPLCAVLSASEALSVGVLERADGDTVTVYCKVPSKPVQLIQLGKIWAEPMPHGYKLLERLHPSWSLER